MTNVKEKLLKVMTTFETDSILREDLLNKAEAFGLRRQDALKALKAVDQSAYEKRNPIVFNRPRLIESLGGERPQPVSAYGPAVVAAPVTARPAPANEEVQVTAPSRPPQAIISGDVVDATLDPTLDNFYATRSYKRVQQRLNPQYPLNIFIFGETGVGKSTSVLHIAKKQGRRVIRANLSKFADIDDLFGGLRIVDGTTYFDQGPALVAMQLGAILLLDEVDSADPQLLTDLHPVLEHKGYLVKKTKQMVYPKPGFCVVATANTNGRGDLTGRYVGTSALNAAFLDRFATGIEYLPPTRTELKHIINMSMAGAPKAIVDGVCDWYEQIGKAIDNGVVVERPSLRKLLDIIAMMLADGITSVSDPHAKEIIVEATNLMDTHTSQAFGELWDSMLMAQGQAAAPVNQGAEQGQP